MEKKLGQTLLPVKKIDTQFNYASINRTFLYRLLTERIDEITAYLESDYINKSCRKFALETQELNIKMLKRLFPKEIQ